MNRPDNSELQHVARSTAYQAGFADGQSWNYEPSTVRVDGWVEDTINARGDVEFGRHVGLSETDVKRRGEAWHTACADYNRGCVDGVTYARTNKQRPR
jgi:hypothetical protein